MAQQQPAAIVDSGKLAFAYRRLVLWFGAELLLFVGSFGLHAFSPESAIGAVLGISIMVAFWVTALALGYYGFRTAAALGSRVAWLWGIAMLVPYMNAISLLLLSSRASKACTAQGIPVGLLGPRLAKSHDSAKAG
jgi:hypothetical protein